MSTGKLCLYISSVLVSFISISQSYAQPHIHGGRSHAHGLPTQGIAHRHGNSSIGQNIQAEAQTSNNTRNNAATTFALRPHLHGDRAHKHPLPSDGIKHQHGSGSDYGSYARDQASNIQSSGKKKKPQKSSAVITKKKPQVYVTRSNCRETTINKYVYEILETSKRLSQESQRDIARKKVIRANLKRCSRFSIPLLTKEIVKQDLENRFAIPASVELGRIGTAAVRPLDKLINHPDITIKRNALLALMLIGKETKPITGSIKKAFYSKDPVVKFRAAVTLLAINPSFSKQIYPLLLSNSGVGKIDILVAINYLGFVDKRESGLLQVLLKYIQHKNEAVRISTFHLIQKLNINIDSIMSRLIRSNTWENVSLRESSERAMETIGDKAIPFLKVSLKHKNRLIRKRAVYILGRFTQKNIQKRRVNRLLDRVVRQASSDSEMKRISQFYLDLQINRKLPFLKGKLQNNLQFRKNKSCGLSATENPNSYDIYTNTCVPQKVWNTPLSLSDFSNLVCEYFGGCEE